LVGRDSTIVFGSGLSYSFPIRLHLSKARRFEHSLVVDEFFYVSSTVQATIAVATLPLPVLYGPASLISSTS
jgi:hypothetical protein